LVNWISKIFILKFISFNNAKCIMEVLKIRKKMQEAKDSISMTLQHWYTISAADGKKEKKRKRQTLINLRWKSTASGQWNFSGKFSEHFHSPSQHLSQSHVDWIIECMRGWIISRMIFFLEAVNRSIELNLQLAYLQKSVSIRSQKSLTGFRFTDGGGIIWT